MSMFIPVGPLRSERPSTEQTHPFHSVHTALSRILFYGRLLLVFSQTSWLQFCIEHAAHEGRSVWLWEDCCFSDICILSALVKAGQSVFSLSIEEANLS